MELHFARTAVVVVAGIPGAGKSTLIRRAAPPEARVVDTDDARARGDGGRGLYVRHYLGLTRAILCGGRPVVMHTRGTCAPARWAIRVLAAVARRPAHLVLVDVPRAVAQAGQHARGRTVTPAAMDAQWRRWRRLVRRGVAAERWHGVVTLDRAQAAAVTALRFGTDPTIHHPAGRGSAGDTPHREGAPTWTRTRRRAV